jgi:hypothetical protein
VAFSSIVNYIFQLDSIFTNRILIVGGLKTILMIFPICLALKNAKALKGNIASSEEILPRVAPIWPIGCLRAIYSPSSISLVSTSTFR